MNLMPEKKNNRNLTDKQKSFLDNLVATEGDFKKAAELAGYSGNHYQVLKSLKEEVVDLASDVLARSAPKAAFKLVEMIDSNKPIPQASQKLNAAQTILDRVGVAKTDRVQVDHNVQGGIFILPEKQAVVIEDAEFSNITEEEDE
jgi:phosphoribosylformylglycinamidine (FGAM) synthase-like enzyme|tara:strand:- start:2307 stop:2741 length:435 start_codon:yes stop_codon:yes gene_type:complete